EGRPPNIGVIARVKPPILTPAEFAMVKQLLAVRTIQKFRGAFLLWGGIILAAFFLTHFVWSLRGFTASWVFLPLLLLLTGIGFTLMVTLRHPLRDIMIFIPYAQGVALGCLAMLAASFTNWEAATAGFSFVPLISAAALSIALMVFGTAPGSSDARVNLGPFQ